jgi:short-subunit dehydrogenase
MELKQKVAIVTGVSKGIGLSVARKFLEKGLRVAGWSRTAPDLEHPNFKFHQVDLRSFESIENAFGTTLQDFGNISVLINNAGIGYSGKMDQMPVSQWMEMFDLNVHALYYCSRLVIPEMKKLKEGHIINIASVAALEGKEDWVGYCGSKYAVRGISQSLYKEVRNFGIKVTCVYPGAVNTNFFDRIDNMNAHPNMMNPDDLAITLLDLLQTSGNCHPVELEIRPLLPRN